MKIMHTQTDDTKSVPGSSPTNKKSSGGMLRAIGNLVVRGCAGIRARNIGIFFLQLLVGRNWETGKIIACDKARQTKKESSAGKKASPVDDFYLVCKSLDAQLVAQRTLNSWGEAVLAAAQNEGWLELPQRTGRDKQPRPKDAAALKQITRQRLRHLAKKYKNLSALRKALGHTKTGAGSTANNPNGRGGVTGDGADQPPSPEALISRTLAVIRNGDIGANCTQLLLQLADAAASAAATLSVAQTPQTTKPKTK